MLVILGALIRLLLLCEILLFFTERIIQLTKSSHGPKFDTVIKDANNNNLEGYL
jgi:hypothetical protein